MISVSDTGSGMTKEILAKAFEPFFTTKEIGKGSGLGLSQVLGFAKQSGGGMRIDTRVGEGTSVKIYLPRAAEDSMLVAAGAKAGLGQNIRTAVILVVDDDSAVREVTATILEEFGHVVLRVGSGGAALDLLERQSNVGLILLDLAMPGMSGTEVERQVQLKHPAIPILYVTGYADRNSLATVSEERIVRKPFIGDELATKVNMALLKVDRRSSSKIVRLRN
jgi:CheY-like chemotaxis protein